MAISVFPAPAASGGSSVSAFAATIPALQRTYEHINNFESGIYTISVAPTSTNAKVTFASDTAVITSVSTTSGTVSVQLTSAATKAYITTRTGGSTNAIVTIQKTANVLTPDDIGNGTLDTINTTSTYNQTGLLGVLVLGGGEGGYYGNNDNNNNRGGAGGRAGFINGDVVFTNTATTVTIGAKGLGQTQGNNTIMTPGNSSFGNLVTANTANNLEFQNGNGGPGIQFGNDAVHPSYGNRGNASAVFPSFNGNSTTGGGAGGNSSNHGVFGAGAGSGIGTGGVGGGVIGNTRNASGKAAGGGGGRGNPTTGSPNQVGGDGSDGVVYILRGF
jgi:hypothetical protein